ncbi:DeoR family fructose operon transcriptional repressor [Bacillus pakistanensis]|uniref:DeoR family fructose operon transcriptional repressor n=1 Tax=Rossellomorea pakistanensis TaxID=992288 RepID=A0ABS2NE03_9BACI|nr:DeoR/GlpR family DNA-binding transcription regulator [Bacillus pakistanensis]MBM7586043.1 DeoR family fructose operon transcriptional repressor [Bacillus pakistanensis]
MLTPERHLIILELLEGKKVVKIQELAEATSSSESTIRRDLSQLEKQSKLKRIHGGASLLQRIGEELSVIEKSTKNIGEKDRIAKYAASLVREGHCIYLDAGTTTFQMIPYLTAKNIIVVTNGLTHLEALIEKNVKTYLIGGYAKQKTRALIGSGAITSLQNYRFDSCFMGVNGIHLEHGFTTPDPEEAFVKSLAMQLSQQAYVVTDHTKFNEVTFSKVAELEEATIITNEIENDLLNEFLEKTTVLTALHLQHFSQNS